MSLSQVRLPYVSVHCSLVCAGNRSKLNKHDSIPKKLFKNGCGSDQLFLDNLWKETQQLMERSEQLVRLITHVCSQKLSGVFRTCGSSFQIPKTSTECCSEVMCLQTRKLCPQVAHSSVTVQILRSGATEFNRGGGGGVKGGIPKLVRTVEPCPSTTTTAAATTTTSPHHPSLSGSWRSSYYCASSGGLRQSTCRQNIPPPPPPSWTFLMLGGEKGGGEIPHSSAIAKRKQSSPNAPSWTKPSIRPIGKTSFFAFLLLLVASIVGVTESCSSRSTPKPRPSSPTLRPNVTFQTYACPPSYAAWFCLNGATCFTVKIQDSILYNCECADGYMGSRCEYKDLDGSYLPARERVLLETASIAGGACIAIVLVFFVLFAMYVFMHKDREKRRGFENPYHDKRPLQAAPSESDFICTITPLHTEQSKRGIIRQSESQVQSSMKKKENAATTNALYLDKLIECYLCEERDLSGHVVCVKHFHQFIVPIGVPKQHA